MDPLRLAIRSGLVPPRRLPTDRAFPLRTFATAPARATGDRSSVDGRTAWRVALAGGTASGVVLGLAGAHGVVIAAAAREPDVGISGAALLAGLSLLLQAGLGPLAGLAADRFGTPAVLRGGALALLVGAWLAAAATDLGTGLLLYGAGTGVAAAAVATPVLAVVSGWFVRRRAAALGAVAASTAFGSLVLAPTLAGIIGRYGLRGAWVTIGVAGGGALVVCAAGLRLPPDHQRVPRSLRGAVRTLRQDRGVRRFYLAGVIGTFGALAPMALVPSFAEELGHRPADAARLVGLSAVAGLVARLAVPALTPPHRVFAVYRSSVVSLAVAFVPWLLAPSAPAWLTVHAAAFGAAFGVWVALSPAVLAGTGRTGLPALMGLVFTAPGVGTALGTWVAGRLVEGTGGHAVLGPVAVASLLIAAAVLVPLTPHSTSGGSHARATP